MTKSINSILFLTLSFSFFWSCSNTPTVNTQTVTNGIDSLAKRDTTQEVDEDEQTYAEALSDLEEFYPTKLSLDSTFFVGKDTFRVKTNFYCTYDNGLTIPATYSFNDTPKVLNTHNFMTELQVFKNGNAVNSTKIDKAFCQPYLKTDELKNYGTVSYPSIHFREGKIQIASGYSIPLTDIGVYLEFFWDDKAQKLVYLGE